jgi:hypothetical protein
VSIQPLIDAWNRFFFAPQSPVPIALYRIMYGLLVIADLAMLHGDWLTWYGKNAFMGIDTLRKVAPGPRLDLFLIIPQNDIWIQAFFWIFLLFAVFLTIGLLTRFSSVVVFVCLTSIHQRNFFILHGGDTLLRVTGFFLMFAPVGAAISVDRLWRIWRGAEGPDIPLQAPWAQRLIQIQVAFLYFGTFYSKMLGSDWIHGTALYYTTRLSQYYRFPAPALDATAAKIATWSTLAVEFSLSVLIWFRQVRYWILLLGICLHLSIEYSMNIPLFQWIIMATYITFIDAADLSRAAHLLANRWRWDVIEVFYNRCSGEAIRKVTLLRVFDVFGRLRLTQIESSDVLESLPDPGRVFIKAGGSFYTGYRAVLFLAKALPAFWVLAPFSFLSRNPVISRKATAHVK